MTDPGTLFAARKVAGAIPDWVGKLLKAWFLWFWRLGRAGKITVTAAEIVVLYLVVQELPLLSQDHQRATVVQAGSLFLCFLLVFGLLFGGSGRR